jgi:hypothetical protein
MVRPITACALLAALTLTGCTNARLYHHVTLPLDINFNNTPVVETAAGGNTKQFRYYVDVNWDSNGIGDIAMKAGFDKVYYADRTVLSIVGVWTQIFVTVYGE